MELKKNPQADVHQRKSTNILIGLNAALILILGLFFYASKPDKPKKTKRSAGNEQIELIPPTEQEPPKAPPPPPSPEVQEIEDESEEEETVVTNDDVDQDTKIKPVVIDVGKGDDPEPIKIDNTIYLDVDESGEFIGGEDKLQEFASVNYNMPKMASDLEISGTIFIQFVVERDGRITQLKAIAPKERQLGYGLEQECMRVIKLTSGKWKPAMRAGKPVRSYWRFPFEVDNSSF